MRKKNWRVVITGGALIGAAAGFYLYMLGLAPQSNNAADLMQTVGMVSGGASGLGIAMIAVGLIGTKT